MICNLQHVKDMKQAEKANILGKPNICELGFHWDEDRRESNIDELHLSTADINHESVLEGLKPFSNLKGLILDNFKGRSFAFIVVNQDNEGIVSSSCNGAAARAPTVAFPALRELVLGDMPNLEEWSGPGVSLSSYSSPATVMFFPRLEGLYIGLCPHLTTIPGHLLSLQELFFDGNRRNQFWEIGKTYHPFSSIEIFSVSGWKSDILMVDSLEKSSKTLKMLTIRTFYQRCYLANNLQNFASLKVLKIENCADIMSLTKETEASCGLTSLQRLSILHCENLTCLPMGLLQQTLVTLELELCQNLIMANPDELLSLTSLQSLSILECPRLASCWDEGLLPSSPWNL
ncbi:hypothetical protein ACSBR1_030733 [Camellia fascicularis]